MSISYDLCVPLILFCTSVYVLYNQNKLILWSIIVAFTAEVTVMIVCLSIVLPQVTFSPDCLVAHAPSLFMSYWSVLFSWYREYLILK